MRLRGIEFNPVMNASGAQGFFGEGYPYHRYWQYLGLTFQGCGKTTTFHENLGNMPLKADRITPRDFKPNCIKAWFFGAHALNAVGLSGPGAEFLLTDGRWQRREKPFLISFMGIGDNPGQRLMQTKNFVRLLSVYRKDFLSPFGLEVNFSCPNVGLDPSQLVGEIDNTLNELADLEIPLVVKLNALVPPKVGVQIAQHAQCDAITMSNSIPYGTIPEKINWPKLFGTSVSPLHKFKGGGGLSGKPLLPIVCSWIREAREQGIKKPIIGCGGIISKMAVRTVIEAGASAIQLGTMAIVRPWRMLGIISEARWRLGAGDRCPLIL